MGRTVKFALASGCAFALLLQAGEARPCTTFSLSAGSEHVFAKSYDWNLSHGILVVNKRDVAKKALELLPGDSGAEWTSKYGSVTFNQYGREFPNSGMNEAGLVVEVMVLEGSVYPSSASTPSVNESQWVQYQLDRHATVADVLADLGSIRVSNVRVPLHYLVCDAGGACATVEAIDGEWNVHTDASLPMPVLTNDTYDDSTAALASYAGFGGSLPIPTSGLGSLTRFIRAADHVASFDSMTTGAVEWAWAGLEKVGVASQWLIVYEQNSRRIQFSTAPVPGRREVDTTAFDYRCGTDVQMLDLDLNLVGDVTTEFVAYDESVNAAVIEKSLDGLLPPAGIALAAAYPSTTSCGSPVDAQQLNSALPNPKGGRAPSSTPTTALDDPTREPAAPVAGCRSATGSAAPGWSPLVFVGLCLARRARVRRRCR